LKSLVQLDVQTHIFVKRIVVASTLTLICDEI